MVVEQVEEFPENLRMEITKKLDKIFTMYSESIESRAMIIDCSGLGEDKFAVSKAKIYIMPQTFDNLVQLDKEFWNTVEQYHESEE